MSVSSISKSLKPMLSVFPVPDYLAMPSVGLSFSDNAIKFIEVMSKKTGLELGRYGEEELSPGIIEAGNIKNPEALVVALQKLRSAHGLKNVKATLPEEKAYLFRTEVSSGVETRLIRDSLEFKIEENVPVSANDTVFDYAIVKNSNSNKVTKMLEVFVTVVPIEVVNSYVEVIKKSGMLPISFVVESSAIARGVIKHEDPRDYLIINIDNKKTGFCIVSDGVVQFTSTLSFGSDDLKSSSVSVETKHKERQTFFHSPILSSLKEEIKKVYMYWITTPSSVSGDGGSKIKKIEKVIVCGRGAVEPDVFEYISSSVPATFEKANVWINAFSFKRYVPGIDAEQSLSYAAAAGLALPDHLRNN